MRARGFTLIELVVIILIIGVLAVVAVPRFGAVADYRARSHYDTLISAARYAQRAAVANGGCRVRVEITGAAWNVLREEPACPSGSFTTTLVGSSGALSGSHPTGVTVSAATFTFSSLGQADASPTVTVSGGGYSDSFSVIAATGYVDD
jgi:MSHA pilin protein MshC